MNKLSVLMLVCICLFCFSCKPKEKFELTLLTEEYPPLSFLAEGKVSGFGSEVVAAIQKELGTSFVPMIMSWDEAYNRALKDDNVVLFTMERTPERENKFHFIGPLGTNTSYFYALASSVKSYDSLEDARKVKAIGTTTSWFSEQVLKDKGFDNLISSPFPVATLKQLENQDVELALFTDVTFAQICKDAQLDPEHFKPVLELMHSQYYIAISKGTDEKIVKDWQYAFDKIKKEGILEVLKHKWLMN